MTNSKEYLVKSVMNILKYQDVLDYKKAAEELIVEISLEQYSLSEIAESTLEAYYIKKVGCIDSRLKNSYESFVKSNKKDLMNNIKDLYITYLA